MNMNRQLKIALITSACGLVIFAGIALVTVIAFANSMGKCGMSAGPCYGRKIELKLNKREVAEIINCPNGKIGFIPAEGKSLPILFKTDLHSNIAWAYLFDTDSCCGIPMLKISGMALQNQGGENSIRFFNNSYSEPGVFILTKDFDFDFLCLSPM